MPDTTQIKNSTLRLIMGDITDLEIDAFVFYAQNNLALGSGFGTAISMRGGPSIRKELESMAPLEVTEAVITSAGNMKSGHIIHAVGPKFQEEDTEAKLALTIKNVLKLAEERGIKRIAFPPMGAGFYGVPVDVSSRITVESISEYLKRGTGIEEVVICAVDSREYGPFQEQLKKLTG